MTDSAHPFFDDGTSSALRHVTCCLCPMTGASRCDVCNQALCAPCYWEHPCLAHRNDYGDSPREHQPHGAENRCAVGAVEAIVCASENPCTGYFQLGNEMYIHVEAFETLNALTLDTGLGRHAFGQSVYDFQVYCEALSWVMPEGFVAFNNNNGRALVFQPGRCPSPIGITNAFSYLRKLNAIGLIICWSGKESFAFSLLEVHRHIGQTLRLRALRKELHLAAMGFDRRPVVLSTV